MSRNISPTPPRSWRQLPGNYLLIFWKLISRSHSGERRVVYFVRSRKLLFVCNLRPPREGFGRESLFSLGLVETWLQGPPSSLLVVRPLSWSRCWIQWSAEGRTAGGTGGDLLWWSLLEWPPAAWRWRGKAGQKKVAMVGHCKEEQEVLLEVAECGRGCWWCWASREDHLVHHVSSWQWGGSEAKGEERSQ